MVPMRKQPSPRDREKDPKLTLSELNSVWNGTLKDPTARSALDQLKREGFNILHLSPQDPTFHHPSWADYIAAIPLLDNRPSRSHFHRKASLRKHLPLVKALRHFARQFDDVVNEIRVIRTGDTATGPLNSLPELADRTASFIEKFLSWDWYVRERNPRNALIAELRWTIRARTGKPHDRELSTVIDAACRAAGRPELCLDNSTLDRIEKREKESRVKCFRRSNFHAGLSPTPRKQVHAKSQEKTLTR